MNTLQITEQISDLLQSKTLPEAIEIIANVLILEGFKYYPLEQLDFNDENQINAITKFILNDRKNNNETLENSTILQGLTLLLWLDNRKK